LSNHSDQETGYRPFLSPSRVAILYHYFHPDEVVSARLFADLAEDLAARGWDVEALTCNRSFQGDAKFGPAETWRGVRIRRLWRPPLRQHTSLGRTVNAIWMIGAWLLCLVFRAHTRRAEVIVVGTDPVLSVLVAGAVKLFRPRVKVAHWAFDLYPEAAIADGMIRKNGAMVACLRQLLRWAYGRCDLIADLGPCMRRQLALYASPARQATLVPWALQEPEMVLQPDLEVRRQLFGDARLALFYSGNLGRAHSFEQFLALARLLRGSGVCFAFAVRGARVRELRAAIRPDDTNVMLAEFASEADLYQRLTAADIHMVSLRENWTGIVVPSKFFGSLAAGRPILYAGAPDSGIAECVREHGIGWVLDERLLADTAAALRRLAESNESLQEMQERCWKTYHRHFSREQTMDGWNCALQELLSAQTGEGDSFSDRPLPALQHANPQPVLQHAD
jgi:colanic acid biosynthesis glycosyl transferase WcaI